MTAMRPLLDIIFGLEGFEMVAFWLALFVAYLLTGYFLDMIMQRQGFGPFLNGLLAYLGLFAGLYIKYNYFDHAPWFRYEPWVTSSLCFGTMALLLLFLSFVRSRMP